MPGAVAAAALAFNRHGATPVVPPIHCGDQTRSSIDPLAEGLALELWPVLNER